MSAETTSTASRPDIIRAVSTPLGFFSLVVLVVEVILGLVAATATGTERTVTVFVMLGVIVGLVGIVAYFAYNRPEALAGQRHQTQVDTEQLTAPLKADMQRLLDEKQRLAHENDRLAAELDRLASVRLQVLSVLGAQSADVSMLISRLVATNDPKGEMIVKSVVGGLVQDGTIEQDKMRSEGYYRLRKSVP